METTFKKKLIASDETQIATLQSNVEKYAIKLQAVFNEADKLSIDLPLHAEGIIESFKTPEIAFRKELEATDLKTDKFISLVRGCYFEAKSVLPFLSLNGKVKVNQQALENFYDENYRFYLTTQDELNDFENTIKFGKLLTSVRRYAKHKYAWKAIKDVEPSIVEPLLNTLK